MLTNHQRGLVALTWCQFHKKNAKDIYLCLNLTSSQEPVSYPDSKVHGANMGTTWVPSAPDGPHVGPMNLAISIMSPLFRQKHKTSVYPTNLNIIPQVNVHTNNIEGGEKFWWGKQMPSAFCPKLGTCRLFPRSRSRSRSRCCLIKHWEHKWSTWSNILLKYTLLKQQSYRQMLSVEEIFTKLGHYMKDGRRIIFLNMWVHITYIHSALLPCTQAHTCRPKCRHLLYT